MKMFDNILKSVGYEKSNSVVNGSTDIMKSPIPKFLYKPPFGYPRDGNIPHYRDVAKTPYIFGVIKTLTDEAAGAKWRIKPKKEFTNEDLEDEIIKVTAFFRNPNGNDESFEHLQKKLVTDLCELDSAVIVKVFNEIGQMTQIFASDGGSFLKNPDIYGYMGNKAEFIHPTEDYYSLSPNVFKKNYNDAAYFQYGWATAGNPIPFGKREIIFMSQHPRTDSVYGTSPIGILLNTIYMLIYGQQHNLDYYLNGNLPEGIVHIPGENKDTARALKNQLQSKIKAVDSLDNNVRIGHTYPILTGQDKPSFIPFTLSAKDMQILEQQKWFIKLVWQVYGVTPDEMGETENSNKAVSQSQTEVHKRKAIKPILQTLSYHYNTQLMPELDETGKLEFVFDEYDMDVEIKKMELYQKQLDIGIKTSKMIAEEEGIELPKLEEDSKDESKEEKGDLKSIRYNIGDYVKVITENPGYTGQTGQIINFHYNKDNELIFNVKFLDGTFIRLFEEEIKRI